MHPGPDRDCGARVNGASATCCVMPCARADARAQRCRARARLAFAVLGAAAPRARRLLDRAHCRPSQAPAAAAAAAQQAELAPGRGARAPAHPRGLRRRSTTDPRLQAHARQHRRQAGRGLRAAGPELPGHHPQLARGQRLRAAERPALRHARADRARQRQFRTRLGAGARDGARDRPPRRDPRGPGAAGRAGQPRRHRSAQRSAARRAGARQIEDRARELLARAGVRGRRHRRRHLGARRLRPLRRRALPHLDGAQRAAARAARQIDPRAPDFLSSHPATPERVTNAVANARQFTGPGRGRARQGRVSRRCSTAWSTARTRARASCAAAGSCIPSSASPSPRRKASRSTTPRRRCSASRTAARRRCGSTSCGCRPSRRCRNIWCPAGSRTSSTKSIEELTVGGFPAATATAERRPMDVPALRGALRQRGLSRHLRGQEPHRGGRQAASATRSTRFRRMTVAEMAQAQPLRIKVVEVTARRHGGAARPAHGGGRPACRALPRAQRTRRSRTASGRATM